MNNRTIRRGASILAATALLGLALAGPGLVGAATPSTSTSITAVPSVVMPGARGAFVATLENTDASTISQLYLAGTISEEATFVAAYPSQGSCSATVASCSFGQVKPGAANAVSVTIVYQTTASTTSVTGSFEFSTVGLGSGGDDKSHGDSWPVSATATTNSDPDFGGRFIDDTNLTVENYQVVGASNPHATKVIAPKSFIGVTVEDGIGAPNCSSGLIDCSNLFGEASYVNVADGATFDGGFRIIITMDSSEIPSGVNANNISIYHTYGTDGEEWIKDRCTFSKGSTVPNNLSCLTVKKLAGGDLQITIWTTHNGVIRGLK